MNQLKRLITIIKITAKYRLDLLIDLEQLPLPLKLLFKLSPLRLFPEPITDRAERLRLTLESLGPIFIKFGQALSTRPDLLPDDIAKELAKLQDNVPPFEAALAKRIIEQALGEGTEQLFKNFNEQPMASASIAQVHKATLHTGQEVVVKVVRPNIEPVIKQDLALLYSLAKFIERHIADGKRLRPVEIVADYQQTILDELDLQREAGNTSQLRRNFIDSNLLYVPEVHFDYCRKNVLVVERIEGIPVSDIAALKAQGTNMKVLAERGVEIFFTQVFRDNFFHADMHPGNIFISREDPENPQYIGIDCAIIGSLSDFERYYLARNLMAIFDRDYHTVARLHVECGWVPPQTKIQDFESAIRSACEPIFEKPLGEISFGQLLIYLFKTARRFDMEIQPSLVLLQKTLLNIEGLGRELYPELSLWDTAKPYLEQWHRDRYMPQNIVEQLKQYAPQWLEQLPQIPDMVIENLSNASSQQAPNRTNIETTPVTKPSKKSLVLGSAAIGGGIIIAQPQLLSSIGALPPLSLGLIVIGAIILLRR